MQIKNDGKLDLATGMSARSKVWKNKRVSWSSLVKKLLTENTTNETYKEYISATKKEKSKIKDVGGYVGGYLAGGKRSPRSVVHKQLLTLDVDYANLEFWDDFRMQYEISAVLHATHSFSKSNPRFRLIIPLDREASTEEYMAVARWIAGQLNIDLFDNTTFETNRLMFWPSNPKDVEYYAKFQDGPWLSVDETLDNYHNWKDTSLWPTSKKVLHEVRDLTAKQKDPLTKPGIIGVFCRTFSIEEVIDSFLGKEYIRGAENRYTYVHGSTSNGLIIYDSIFAYSHHGTDPISGMLCNAFDLVRIHKYGHLDENTKQTQATKLPSYKEMEAFARSLNPVKNTVALETINGAKYDFAEDIEEDELPELPPEDLKWAEDLEIDGRGRYLSSSANLNLIFKNDSRLKGLFKFNVFNNKRYVMQSLPWRKIEEPEPIRDVDYSGVRNYIECTYGITGVGKIDDAIALEFEKQSFHPIRDYLNSLHWDNVKRLDTILVDYFGAPDELYTHEAIRKTLCAAVARVFNPGIKYDLVLTLVGDQGTGKSTLINKLGKSWASDTFSTVNGKEAFEQLQGAWLIEMAELAGLRKAEVEAIKHFITKQEDSYRPAYGRTIETFKRQCVFFGTTNNVNFLRDPTGNRRFMPIDVRPQYASLSVFDDLNKRTVDQIWAEAVLRYRKGEKLYLSKEANDQAKVEQKEHSVIDERVGIVEAFLDMKLPENWYSLDTYSRVMFLEDGTKEGTVERDVVCVAEIWCECFGKNRADMDRYKTRDINEIMKSMDKWEKIKSTKNFKPYGLQRYYARKLY